MQIFIWYNFKRFENITFHQWNQSIGHAVNRIRSEFSFNLKASFVWLLMYFLLFSFNLFFSSQCYNEHLLKYALQCLVGISYTSNSDIKSLECNDATVIRDVLNYANLIKESMYIAHCTLWVTLKLNIFVLILLFLLPDCEDPLTIWWASLFSIDACWLLGDDTMADKLFEHVRKMPKALRESKDPLARTAVTVFCAKKLLA